MDGWALLEARRPQAGLFDLRRRRWTWSGMAHILLDEFRGGKMGRITLELPEDLERGADPSGVP